MNMPHNRKSSAPLVSPCLACKKPTRRDGYCRTRGCPNRFPDPAEARAAAVAIGRKIAAEYEARR